MEELIDLKVRVVRKMFYSEEGSFGVFAVEPVTNTKAVKLNKYRNFVVNGKMQQLIDDQEYDLTITETHHPKYGKGYTVVKVGVKEYTTPQEQQIYIRSIIAPRYAEAIISKYPNEKIIDLFRNDEIDYSKIKGIGKPTYEKLKKKVLENVDIQRALVELDDLEITFESMKKLIHHFGSADIVVQKVKENIYSLCSVSQFGFLKVDGYAMKRGDDPDSSFRIDAAIEFMLKQEEQNGHTWINRVSAIEKLKDLLSIDYTTVSNRLVDLEGKEGTIYITEDKVALYRNYQYETNIKNKLLEMIDSKNELIVNDVDQKIEELESKNGFTYTDEQRNAIKLAIENNVLVLNGKAGTGKTFTLKGVLAALSEHEHVCCALSGKASKILASHGLNAMTIHRMLGYKPGEGFMHDEENPLDYEVVILDEAGMCSSYLFHSVLAAIPEGGKLIIVGDSAQLPSIGSGSVFDDLLHSPIVPKQELTIVQRQAQKSGILSIANEIREGKQVIASGDYNKRVFGELKDLYVFPTETRERIQDMTLKICERYKDKDLNEFQVICGLKSKGELSAKNLNIALQKVFNDMSKPFVKRGQYEYREGDKIIQCGNNYKAQTDKEKELFHDEEFDVELDVKKNELTVFNGTLGKIIEIRDLKNDKEIYIQFEGIEDTIVYSVTDLDQVELAYAITCHKSQGSTIKHVLFVFGYDSYSLLSRGFLYTGITRASDDCVIVCENRALRHSIRTDHTSKRNTFLKDFLNEVN
ncbi:AAA family ATPase [Priestia flexa]|uniref:AAA family ATPase n=1 Tax=Priestia flexa TaxID=86664 RepID=UPI0004740766|nr:AAA family ATPase [Priestia flexa]